MITIEVCSLRDRGEPQERDVLVTRPGSWGNQFTLERYGWRALDLYREWLLKHEQPAFSARRRALKVLADKRLLCACPADALACHAWILAEEVARLTGAIVVPAPGRDPLCQCCIGQAATCVGRHEAGERVGYACDSCCVHAPGGCERLPWAPELVSSAELA